MIYLKKTKWLRTAIITASIILLSNPTMAVEKLGKMEFKEAKLGDAIRVISELSQDSEVIATPSAQKKVISIYLKKSTVESAVDAICRVSSLWYRYTPEHKTYIIMTEDEFKKDIIVKKPAATEVYELKHQNVSDAAYAIESLYGERVELMEPQENSSYELEGDIGGGGGSGGSKGGNSNNRSSSNSSSRSSNNSRSSGGGDGGRNQDEIEARRDFFDVDALRKSGMLVLDESALVKSNIRSEVPIYVTWNYLHNLLMVRTSDSVAVKEISKLIKRLDQPAQQVLLEMKVYSATLGDEERSVFDYNYASNEQTQTGVDESGNPIFSPKAQLGLGNFPQSGGTFLAQLTGSEVQVTIELLKTENRIELLSQPNILSANNKEAILTVGEDRVMVTGVSQETIVTESGTNVFQTYDTTNRNIGTVMHIWPRINGDNTVTLDIIHSNTTLNKGASNIGSTIIDSVTESTVRLTAITRHSGTIAIGGMIQTEQQESHEKVPLLGDIPVLGKLFRKDATRNRRTEMIILITPFISKDPATAYVQHKKRIEEWTDNEEIIDSLESPIQKKKKQWTSKTKKKAIDLIRQAASASQQNRDDICGTQYPTKAPRFNGWGVEENIIVEAVGHCQRGNLYLTKAKVYNTGSSDVELKPDVFNQGWVASSGETQIVPPNSNVDIYLVSTRKPEAVVRRSKKTFFLTEASIYDQ